MWWCSIGNYLWFYIIGIWRIIFWIIDIYIGIWYGFRCDGRGESICYWWVLVLKLIFTSFRYCAILLWNLRFIYFCLGYLVYWWYLWGWRYLRYLIYRVYLRYLIYSFYGIYLIYLRFYCLIYLFCWLVYSVFLYYLFYLLVYLRYGIDVLRVRRRGRCLWLVIILWWIVWWYLIIILLLDKNVISGKFKVKYIVYVWMILIKYM